jgi:hypothetical protein
MARRRGAKAVAVESGSACAGAGGYDLAEPPEAAAREGGAKRARRAVRGGDESAEPPPESAARERGGKRARRAARGSDESEPEGAARGGSGKRGDYLAAGPHSTRCALLVRSHKPSAGALLRVGEWAEQAAALEGLDLWVQIDRSSEASAGTRADITAALPVAVRSRVHFHEYTQDDMTAAYPALAALRESDAAMGRTKELQSGHYSLAWGFHTEAINLWFVALPERERYAHVWVFEDDVGFSGDLAHFLASCERCEADLLADTIVPCAQGWWWTETVSPGYAERVPADRRVQAREHVQRLSRRLLLALHGLAQQGVVGWSEQSTPSLCAWMGMALGPIPGHLVGHVFSWDGRVLQSDFDKWRRAKSPRYRNKLFHALKW